MSPSLQIESGRWNDSSTRTSLNNTARSVYALCRSCLLCGLNISNWERFCGFLDLLRVGDKMSSVPTKKRLLRFDDV